ncbi:hypothetical protein AO385_0919 [Moraxella catarrhalis]|uniref:Uncharacterized protein n=1 Tax=Moraxella catarrhalis TaxID=480 RepID=A0A198US79_MORCA|nr:hypothetical protein AO384_1369 [Moraxella catarrhalis]OAU96943.1 hypothetical protein AO383_1267 [Moraxella catarrhalis]OAU98615.1 hypothetical protein AO383_0543 [Moraxella catarrhalis]OAU99129.1 hypothetical protein AO382_2151 [Moraxella catarrhalis]OAV02638.1 hypothetical protein AO385_0919 [Moraxella catarrhalis]
MAARSDVLKVTDDSHPWRMVMGFDRLDAWCFDKPSKK